MKRKDFKKLIQAIEQALAIERGELAPARITIREVPTKHPKQMLVPLDTDIVEAFKQRAAQTDSASYLTQINQALRESLRQNTEEQNDELAERIAQKVAAKLSRSPKRKAA